MGTDGNDRDETDPGEPITALTALSVEPSNAFAGRLRRRIERREASNHVLWLVWYLPAVVLLTFIEMTFALIGSDSGDAGGKK